MFLAVVVLEKRMHHRCVWLLSFCCLGEQDAPWMFLVVAVLFLWRKECTVDVSGGRRFVF